MWNMQKPLPPYGVVACTLVEFLVQVSGVVALWRVIVVVAVFPISIEFGTLTGTTLENIRDHSYRFHLLAGTSPHLRWAKMSQPHLSNLSFRELPPRPFFA